MHSSQQKIYSSQHMVQNDCYQYEMYVNGFENLHLGKKRGILEACAVFQLSTGAWIDKSYNAVLISLLQNECFMILYAGLGSSPRLEIPKGRTNDSKQCAQPEPFPIDRSTPLRGRERSWLNTHIVKEIVRAWMEADLISVQWNCSTASFALALID